ncbi:hypothetical protein MP638_006014 [Amoeboaphelidium occidentale]|nr:hypothetical protein MP638_006014 [Amoeboaphelidium occidentale]
MKFCSLLFVALGALNQFALSAEFSWTKNINGDYKLMRPLGCYAPTSDRVYVYGGTSSSSRPLQAIISEVDIISGESKGNITLSNENWIDLRDMKDTFRDNNFVLVGSTKYRTIFGASSEVATSNAYGFVAKVDFDFSGNLTASWAKIYGSYAGDVTFTSVVIGTDGSIAAIGEVRGEVVGIQAVSYGSIDILAIRYDPNGNIAWSYILGGRYAEAPGSVLIDGTGNVYVSGMTTDGFAFQGTFVHAGFFVLKISQDGALLWVNSWNLRSFGHVVKASFTENGEIAVLTSFDKNRRGVGQKFALNIVDQAGSSVANMTYSNDYDVNFVATDFAAKGATRYVIYGENAASSQPVLLEVDVKSSESFLCSRTEISTPVSGTGSLCWTVGDRAMVSVFDTSRNSVYGVVDVPRSDTCASIGGNNTESASIFSTPAASSPTVSIIATSTVPVETPEPNVTATTTATIETVVLSPIAPSPSRNLVGTGQATNGASSSKVFGSLMAVSFGVLAMIL